MTWIRGRLHDQRGSIAAVAAALMAPVLVGLMMLVVYAGRLSQAESQVRSAATSAARAASLRHTAGLAQAEATQVATDNLADAEVACRQIDVTVDTSRLAPAGTVTAQVSCTASLADLTLLELPGSKTIGAAASAPVDTYRAGGP